MKIGLKYHWVVYVIVLLSGCVWTSETIAFTSNQQNHSKECHDAKKGKFNTKTGDYSNPLKNARILSCAVAVTIGLPDDTKKQRETIRLKKCKAADFLLSKKLDISYTNDNGDTLLMAVIISFLPDEWKERAVKILISRGINICHKNKSGNTAIDYAKFKGNKKIISILSEKAN